MKIVISQSMYFPWLGFLEQLHQADIFVRYDDVQFSKGSFANRVQIKTEVGLHWLTVPLSNLHLGQSINEVQLNNHHDWPNQHLERLKQAYQKAPFKKEMLDLAETVFAQQSKSLSQVTYASVLALSDYFNLTKKLRIFNSSSLGIYGKGTKRVLDIVLKLGGTTYITGHGARNYLDHKAFEQAGIAVEYMKYRCLPYPQLHGDFTPYVSALDLVANCGREGVCYMQSNTVSWRNFINEPT